MEKISDEELRARRLHYMENRSTSSESQAKRPNSRPENSHVLSTPEIDELISVLYRGGEATAEDLQRWYEQGFNFVESSTFNYGLRQGLGGPCGILAAVQAEMIRLILFTDSIDSNGTLPASSTGGAKTDKVGKYIEELPVVSRENVEKCFAMALCCILDRARRDRDFKLVETVDGTFSGLQEERTRSNLMIVTFETVEDVEAYIANRYVSLYNVPSGCVFFLLSLVLTRGMDRIRKDMDVDDNTLIGQFGHCTQDLINLLLTGKATSNVIDGSIPVGDSGLMVKGVSHQSSIGYLTHLEALQYCQVGNYFKVPANPVWVVGSSSHFTVLFCTDTRINEESESERLQSKVLRAFKKVDVEECGFIPNTKLQEALFFIDETSLYEILGDEEDVARLRGYLTTDGDIIIWSKFWETVSRLCIGASLEDIIDAPMQGAMGIEDGETRQRSDSDIAREMQQQFDNESTTAVTTAAVAPEPHESTTGRPRSDSDLAREWQKQLDEGLNPDFSDVITSSTTAPVEVPASTGISANNTFSALSVDGQPAADEDDDNLNWYSVYHFNGLENKTRKAKLTPFVLKPQSSVDSIGQSVQMSGGTTGTSYLCPIEEVIRTRWNKCRLDFGTEAPPSID